MSEDEEDVATVSAENGGDGDGSGDKSTAEEVGNGNSIKDFFLFLSNLSRIDDFICIFTPVLSVPPEKADLTKAMGN